MKSWFYYKIKARSDGDNGWAWPPIHSDRIEAESREDARKLIEADYGDKFVMKMPRKGTDKSFLLSVAPMTAYDERLFTTHKCESCGLEFRIIDKYNDPFATSKGSSTHCSRDCYLISREVMYDTTFMSESADSGNEATVGATIYCITNIATEMKYVGRTTQPFTLRWYQHIFQNRNSAAKFHVAIRATKISEWSFSVLEILPKGVSEKLIREREDYWITTMDAVSNGYNSREEIAKPSPSSSGSSTYSDPAQISLFEQH